MRRLVTGLVLAGLLLTATPADAGTPKEVAVVTVGFSPIQSRQAELRQASSYQSEQARRPSPSQGDASGVSAPVPLLHEARTGERRHEGAAGTTDDTLRGVASTYGSGYSGLTAVPIRDWRGKRVRICYREECLIRTVNDLGPDQRVFPDRVVDLDEATFEALCRCHWEVVGVLRGVTVSLIDWKDLK